MMLSIGARSLEFHSIKLEFPETGITNVFAKKNNKTLGETLEHRRYAPLSVEMHVRYPNSLNRKLGEFLHELKMAWDPVYRKFLNKYGDLSYCTFFVQNSPYSQKKGLYCFASGEGEVIKYIGKTTDGFKKRINQGYGKIHPKNCYLDGQATNCHLNALIAENSDQIRFYVCPVESESEIAKLEAVCIQRFRPEWNIALGPNSPTGAKAA